MLTIQDSNPNCSHQVKLQDIVYFVFGQGTAITGK